MEGEVGRERVGAEESELRGKEELIEENEEIEIAHWEAEGLHDEKEKRREVQIDERSEEDELIEVEESPQHLEGDLAKVRETYK